jgi:hypothetical protein
MPSAALLAPSFQAEVITRLDDRLELVRALKGTSPDFLTVERAVWNALSNKFAYGLCEHMLRAMHTAGELKAVSNQGSREDRILESWSALLTYGPDDLTKGQREDASDLLFHALKDIRYRIPFEHRGTLPTDSTVSDDRIDALIDEVREEVIAFSRTASYSNENEAFVSLRCSITNEWLDMRLRDGAPVLLDRRTQEEAPEFPATAPRP